MQYLQITLILSSVQFNDYFKDMEQNVIISVVLHYYSRRLLTMLKGKKINRVFRHWGSIFHYVYS